MLKGLAVPLSCWRIRPLSAAFRVELGADVEIEGRVWVPGPGRVHLGRGVRLRGRRAPIELRAHDGAEIWLDDGVVVEAGVSIEATRRVQVAARATIGAFSKIIDNHYHRTIGNRAERPAAVPIFVGEDAAIGPRAILLPGARVAARAVVGAGRVLSARLEAEPSRSAPAYERGAV
jgi:acetyltransferase-like isoleucine patch superfamily enzyme